MKIFALLSLGIAALIMSYWLTVEDDVEYYKDRDTLNEICALLEEDCSQVEEPIVVITKAVPYNYYGMYYPGERYIFIQYGISKPYRHVEIHETVHYIMYELGKHMSRCDSERMARSVTAILTDTEVDPTWAKRYGCDKIGTTPTKD